MWFAILFESKYGYLISQNFINSLFYIDYV